MNDDFNIDYDEFARYVRDAERMRAEALRDLLFAVRAKVWGLCVATGKLTRSAVRRRKWNLSVPAPHH